MQSKLSYLIHEVQIILFDQAEENCSFRIWLTRKLSIGLQARKETASHSLGFRGSPILQSDRII